MATSLVLTSFIAALFVFTSSGVVAAPPIDCSLRPPSAPCVPHSCTLDKDTRDCSQSLDVRDCNVCVLSAFGRCLSRGNDPTCELQKAIKNKESDVAKAKCEQERDAQNSAYATQYAACQAASGTELIACQARAAAIDARWTSICKPTN